MKTTLHTVPTSHDLDLILDALTRAVDAEGFLPTETPLVQCPITVAGQPTDMWEGFVHLYTWDVTHPNFR